MGERVAVLYVMLQQEQVCKARNWRCRNQVWSKSSYFLDAGRDLL